jgi:Flp pilus assembly protein TadG
MNILKNKSKGQIIILVAIALVILLAFVGFALDVGIAYGVKAKLNAAVDAASIAAGRAVKHGSSDSERSANAHAAANQFFSANFPSGYMGATAPLPNINAVHNANGSWTISVTAGATVPTYFARVVGRNNFSVAAAAEATARDMDMILVLDCSGSLGPDTSSPTTFPNLKAAAVSFLDRFEGASGGDRLGLVSFASGAVLSMPINKTNSRGFDKTAMTNAINSLTVEGSTASGEAMRLAKAELDAVPANLRSSLRVIVFFTDGAPNDVSGTFDLGGTSVTGDLYSETDTNSPPSSCQNKAHRTWYINQRNNSPNGVNGHSNGCSINELPDTDYTGTVNLASFNNKRSFTYNGSKIANTRCNVNKAARNMLENVANSARNGTGTDAVTIMTIGFGSRVNSNEIIFCAYGSNEYGANILKRLANSTDSDTYNGNQPSGQYFPAPSESDLNSVFQAVASAILRLSK